MEPCWWQLVCVCPDWRTVTPNTKTSSFVSADLEVGALTQDVVADVQVALRGRLGSFTAGRTLCGGHAQLTGLGERLQVVVRHGPEVKVGLVPEQPATHNKNKASAEPRLDGALSGEVGNMAASSSGSLSSPPPPLHVPLPCLSFPWLLRCASF